MDILRNERLGINNKNFDEQRHKWLYEEIDKDDRLEFPKIHAAVNSLSIETVESRYLLAGGADTSIKLFDLEAVDLQPKQDSDETVVTEPFTQVPRDRGHKFGVSSIKWWPFDNGLFVTSSFDGTVKVWDPNTMGIGEEAYNFDMGSNVYNIDISSVGDHSLVATASDHPFIRLLDLRTTSSSHTLAARGPGTASKNLTVKWSPSNAHILASGGSDGSVKLWDIRQSNACLTALDMQQSGDIPTNSKLEYRKAHRGSVNGLVWFSSGDYLISFGNDEKLRLWSLYPPGGKNMLVNYGPMIRNRHVQTLDPCLSPTEDLEFPYLFAPSDSGEIFMFQAVDGKTVKRLNRGVGKTSRRPICVISRGASTLQFFSGSMDGLIHTWSPQPKVNDGNGDGDDSDEEPRLLNDIWNKLEGQRAKATLKQELDLE